MASARVREATATVQGQEQEKAFVAEEAKRNRAEVKWDRVEQQQLARESEREEAARAEEAQQEMEASLLREAAAATQAAASSHAQVSSQLKAWLAEVASEGAGDTGTPGLSFATADATKASPGAAGPVVVSAAEQSSLSSVEADCWQSENSRVRDGTGKCQCQSAAFCLAATSVSMAEIWGVRCTRGVAYCHYQRCPCQLWMR